MILFLLWRGVQKRISWSQLHGTMGFEIFFIVVDSI
jgi:hypothetical protein